MRNVKENDKERSITSKNRNKEINDDKDRKINK